MQELFVLVAKKSPHDTLQVCGCVTREAAHRLGFPHAAVQLVPVTWDRERDVPLLLLHQRSPHKLTCPEKWDFCGGHLTFEAWYCHLLEKALDSAPLLARAADETAVREANEELHCEPPFQFLPQHVHRFRSVGFFECRTESERGVNVEFSTAYVVAVPAGRHVAVWDTDARGERQLEARRFTWPELRRFFQDKPQDFADGAGRILSKLGEDTQLASEFERLVQDVGRAVARDLT